MTRLNFTAEGFSEERFVKDILAPHLVHFNVVVDVRRILTNRKLRKRGGIVSFQRFKNDVTQWIKEQPNAYHTTFIDLYGLINDFPNFKETLGKEPYHRVTQIEAGIAKEINHHTFIPYIQLHEYEALLFSDPQAMLDWLSLYNGILVDAFSGIKAAAGGNPELINDSPETAPSKRILAHCETYDKIDDGILILKEIGLPTLRAECKHFDAWITQLEKLGQASTAAAAPVVTTTP